MDDAVPFSFPSNDDAMTLAKTFTDAVDSMYGSAGAYKQIDPHLLRELFHSWFSFRRLRSEQPRAPFSSKVATQL